MKLRSVRASSPSKENCRLLRSVRVPSVVFERRDLLLQKDIFLSFPPTDDTLEFAENVADNSRLSCQIHVTDALDGLRVTIADED